MTIVGPARAMKNVAGSCGAAPAARRRSSTRRLRSGRMLRPPWPTGKCTHASPRSNRAPRKVALSTFFGSHSERSASSSASMRARSGSTAVVLMETVSPVETGKRKVGLVDGCSEKVSHPNGDSHGCEATHNDANRRFRGRGSSKTCSGKPKPR